MGKYMTAQEMKDALSAAGFKCVGNGYFMVQRYSGALVSMRPEDGCDRSWLSVNVGPERETFRPDPPFPGVLPATEYFHAHLNNIVSIECDHGGEVTVKTEHLKLTAQYGKVSVE